MIFLKTGTISRNKSYVFRAARQNIGYPVKIEFKRNDDKMLL
jgi:hypothetical protein